VRVLEQGEGWFRFTDDPSLKNKDEETISEGADKDRSRKENLEPFTQTC
jgi:hypothetical protein